MSFWDVVWFIVISFAFIAYLMVLFAIITDLFRDRGTSGFAKGVWIVALIVVPFLSALVYLVVRGRSMADRSQREAETVRTMQESYIREVAATASPVDQVARAKDLLDSGAISPAEYESLKAAAMH